jgi:hypothetical protein
VAGTYLLSPFLVDLEKCVVGRVWEKGSIKADCGSSIRKQLSRGRIEGGDEQDEMGWERALTTSSL